MFKAFRLAAALFFALLAHWLDPVSWSRAAIEEEVGDAG